MKNRTFRFTLQARMILLITILAILIVGLIGLVFYSLIAQTIEEQVGKRALNTARIVANLPEVRAAFDSANPSVIIQPLAENVRRQTGAEFVVVGDKHGIRLAHPLVSRIGKEMVGGDSEDALQHGASYVSKAVGSLGPSLRGKTPVLNEQGEIVGIVSVGFLLEDIDEMVAGYRTRILLILIVSLVIGIVGAIWLSRYFKRAILGLEPEEITALFVERNALIESVREGIVAIDRHGNVTMVNQAATAILNLPPREQVIKQPITHLIPNTKMLEVLKTGEQQLDREFNASGKEILVNRVPIQIEQNVIGVVSSFRPKSDIEQLSAELSQVKRYADVLRAQTHEFHNLLYTISGLLQLGSIQEAIELISSETNAQQEMVLFLAKKISDPLIGALLVGMQNRAKELKIQFVINEDSQLQPLPPEVNRQQLIIIMANLIQNAFEAVLDSRVKQKYVECYVSYAGKEFLFEVDDSGPGIDKQIQDKIFAYGFSTKQGENRGIGLAKVKTMVEEMNGYILVSDSERGGSLFTISLPMRKEQA
ncbi:ATP-binding protein [Brevibacillus fulvus]|uniref:histidine kinase n=1 Tax=Brevibacillus fulvus TaxID=1125967 RepID=A0A938XZB0_9BACL|nr:sensor histidine kinase [Brevibacillus fulvus]MBM7590450.1 two-component system CitB family sensor kinase [Brevibacillus fulvus]